MLKFRSLEELSKVIMTAQEHNEVVTDKNIKKKEQLEGRKSSSGENKTKEKRKERLVY